MESAQSLAVLAEEISVGFDVTMNHRVVDDPVTNATAEERYAENSVLMTITSEGLVEQNREKSVTVDEEVGGEKRGGGGTFGEIALANAISRQERVVAVSGRAVDASAGDDQGGIVFGDYPEIAFEIAFIGRERVRVDEEKIRIPGSPAENVAPTGTPYVPVHP